MDSLTQIVLGGAIGELVLGKKAGNKAILWGAVAGTIPDLDVVNNWFFDELTANELHRGVTHSILFCLLVSPIFAWLTKRQPKIFLSAFLTLVFAIPVVALNNWVGYFILIPILLIFIGLNHRSRKKESAATTKDYTILFFLGFLTHVLLDCQTSWGTQIFWPFDLKVAWNNVFVADPLYTLPFMIFLILTMFYRKDSRTRRRLNGAGLIISSFYLLLTVVFKFITYQKIQENLQNQNIAYKDISTRPTPLNSILWTANVEMENNYLVGYTTLLNLNKPIEFLPIDKNHDLGLEYVNDPITKRIIKLSQNEYAFSVNNDTLQINDLRFGVAGFHPDSSQFVFSYQLFRDEGGNVCFKAPEPRPEEGMKMMSKLWDRILGK